MSGGFDKPMEEFEAGMDAGITVGEWKEEMRSRLRPAAERAGIEINSTVMWPMCAMSPFIEACDRIVDLRNAVIHARNYILATEHQDNCGPKDCRCGKDRILAFLKTTAQQRD